MMRKLVEFRAGNGGAILFYGYLIAILITACLALASFRSVTSQNARLEREVQHGRMLDARSCNAISGAGQFWRLVRRSTYALLKDDSLTPTARASNLEYVAALTSVITKIDKLNCKVSR